MSSLLLWSTLKGKPSLKAETKSKKQITHDNTKPHKPYKWNMGLLARQRYILLQCIFPTLVKLTSNSSVPVQNCVPALSLELPWFPFSVAFILHTCTHQPILPATSEWHLPQPPSLRSPHAHRPVSVLLGPQNTCIGWGM